MKNFYSILFLLFFYSLAYSQQDSTKTWIEVWQKSTVSIGKIDTVVYKTQKIPFYRVIGTGVLFYTKYDTIVIPCLITAKHIFEDLNNNWSPTSVRIRFSWFDNIPIDKYLGIELHLKDSNRKLWFSHPDNNVDLACLPILGFPINALQGNNSKIPMIPYSQIAESIDIYEGESIIVFGYPGAVGPDFNTKAIVRQGIIAWTPSNPATDSKVLIDCDVFPGNSGGPVFAHPIGLSRGGSFELGKATKFLGIVVERRKSETEIFSSSNPNVPLKDNRGQILLSYESIGIGVVESSIKVRELLSHVQKEINK